MNLKGHVSVQDTIAAAKRHLESEQAVLFLGPPGVGKTVTGEILAKELGLNLVILNASQASKEDLALPAKEQTEDGRQVVKLITHDFNNTLLLLDEITNANPDLMSALLSLVLSKRIGNTTFENLLIVATGNRTGESILANPLPLPLIQRFAVLDFPVPTKDEWVDFVLAHEKEHASAVYLNFVKNGLSTELFNVSTEDGEVTDFQQRPSPRSHSAVSKFLSQHFPTVKDIQNNLSAVRLSVNSLAGPDVASAFVGWVADSVHHFTLNDLLVKKRTPENPSQYFQLIIDAAVNIRPPEDVLKNPRKNYKKIAELSPMIDKLINVGNEASLRMMRGLVPRYVLGSERLTQDQYLAAMKIIIKESAQKNGTNSPIKQFVEEMRKNISDSTYIEEV